MQKKFCEKQFIMKYYSLSLHHVNSSLLPANFNQAIFS